MSSAGSTSTVHNSRGLGILGLLLGAWILIAALYREQADTPPEPPPERAPTPEEIISADFDRELQLAAAELSGYARERVHQFRFEAEAALPEAARAAALIVGDFDSYWNRASMDDAELALSISEVARLAFDERIAPLAERAATDIFAVERDLRRSLLAGSAERAGRCDILLSLAGIREQSFFEALSRAEYGGLKLLDEAVEFVPLLGDLYGLGKLLYDPRLENTILEPAEKHFVSTFRKEVERAAALMLDRYADVESVRASIRSDWSAADALGRLEAE